MVCDLRTLKKWSLDKTVVKIVCTEDFVNILLISKIITFLIETPFLYPLAYQSFSLSRFSVSTKIIANVIHKCLNKAHCTNEQQIICITCNNLHCNHQLWMTKWHLIISKNKIFSIEYINVILQRAWVI